MAPPEDVLCEATRRSQPPGTAEGASARGNPRAYRRHCRKMRVWATAGASETRRRRSRGDAGQPGDSFAARAEGPKDRGFEATRSSIAGTAVRCSRGATRGRIEKLNGSMPGPSNLWFTAIEAPETPVSGAFVFAALGHGYKRLQP
jgi:hypothetical protein